MPDTDVAVSGRCAVVIATRNRPDALASCLDGLCRQSVTDFSVVVVDDASDAPLTEVTGRPQFDQLSITVVRLPLPSGPAAARNAGVAEADAEFIVFLDDDVVADRYFLEVHLATVGRSAVGEPPIVSCGPFVQPADWVPTPWNLWEARQAKKEADAMLRGDYAPTWRQFHTGNNCLPAAVFRAVGGFDESFKRAEDDELALRLDKHGCRFEFTSSAIGWHYSNRTLTAWLAIPRAYAFFDVEIDRIHPEAGYLAGKKNELQHRRAPLRLVRSLARGQRRSAWAVSATVAIAKVAYRLGLVEPAMGALSVAYDLIYVESLAESEGDRIPGDGELRPPMLVDGRLLPNGAQLRAAVVVIGAGPAGITIAHELASAGIHVMVIEGGGRRHGRGDDDALRGQGTGVPFPLVGSRRRGFGGTSGHWTAATGLRIRPLDAIDFERRTPRPDAASWPFGASLMEPYYERAHEFLAVPSAYQPDHWFGDHTPPSSVVWPDGPQLAMFRFVAHDCFVSRFDELTESPYVDLVLNSSVVGIEQSGSEVTSAAAVCPDGNRFSVRAGTFVLAAGGIDNARVLLASPGPSGRGVGNEHDNVGRYFMDHLSVDTGTVVVHEPERVAPEVFTEHAGVGTGEKYQPMLWLGDDRIRQEGLLNAAFWLNDLDPAYLSPGVGAARNLTAALRSSPVRDVRTHLAGAVRGAGALATYATQRFSHRGRRVFALRIMTEQVPDPQSRISLSPERDRLGLPRVSLDWRISTADLETIREHQDVLSRLLEANEVGTVGDRFDPSTHSSPIMSNYHHMGATRMHPEVRHGVVDADCRVHTAPNLFVAGSSVFPTGGYLNPTLTIIALAIRIADSVKREVRPVTIR